MAGKKIPSLEDALKYFKEVMKRSSLKDYVYVNNIMISKNPKGHSVMVIPDHELWLKIIDDPELKGNMRELDPTNIVDSNQMKITRYANKDEGWIDINPETVYSGSVIVVNIDKLEYDIMINKNLLPLKLKKSEINNVSYRVFTSPENVMCIKKIFDPIVPDAGFTMIRLWQVL